MSEAIFNGPLDVSRRFIAYAVKLDELATQCPDRTAGNYKELQMKLFELNAKNPLLHQSVIAYGTVLTASFDDEENLQPLSLPPSAEAILRPGATPEEDSVMSLWLPPTQENVTVTGEYFGLDLRSVYDPQLNQTATRVVHVVCTGGTKMWDEHRVNRITTEHYSYVCVDESELQPTLPLSAHSFEDLRQDPVYEACIDIVTQDIQPKALIRKLGKVANAFLSRDEIEPAFQNQFVSWLNSIELLSGVLLRTRNVAIATRENFMSGEDVRADTSNIDMVLQPAMLDYAPGYYMLSDGSVEMKDNLELYATAPCSDVSERIIFMPIKKVIDVELLTNINTPMN